MDDEKICSFCGETADAGLVGVVRGKTASICDGCVVAAVHTLADNLDIPRTCAVEVLAYRQAMSRMRKKQKQAEAEFAQVEKDSPNLVHPNS